MFHFLQIVMFVSMAWATPQQIQLASPNGHVQIAVHLDVLTGTLKFHVGYDQHVVVEDSRLGLRLREGGSLSKLAILEARLSESDSSYVMPIGKTHDIRDHFRQLAVKMIETAPPFRRLNVIFRAYDDGVAFRYVLPEQPFLKDFVITAEDTQFSFSGHPKIYALPLPFGSAYEAFYKIGSFTDFPAGETLGLPLLIEYPSLYVGLTEAALMDYAGMYVTPTKATPATFATRLAPDVSDPEVKVRGTTPFVSPWRVLLLGNSPRVLVESNLVNNLNEPSAIADTSWIRPGKVQFPWWNGYVVPPDRWRDPQQPPGLNTWTLQYYIDFCADNGIEFHSIDGYEMSQAWYGGAVLPYLGTDITQVIAEIAMPTVLNYGHERGVGTRLWLHSDGLRGKIEPVLSTYERWGVSGIMVDFINDDSQQGVRFANDILKAAARHHLTVTFHGIHKPTGLGRTYPNLLSQEAVLGLEYDKWSDVGSPADHEVLIAYIRMMAGPLDTHEGSFRPVAPADFKPVSIAPHAMGTLARQLAMYVVYENHLPMLADYPAAYLQQPKAFRFVREVPVVWDETRLVTGQVGQYIAIARRRGQEWYVGTLTDQSPRRVDLDLSFLGAGEFVAETYADDVGGPAEKVRIDTQAVTATDHLSLRMAGSGGHAIHLSLKTAPQGLHF